MAMSVDVPIDEKTSKTTIPVYVWSIHSLSGTLESGYYTHLSP